MTKLKRELHEGTTVSQELSRTPRTDRAQAHEKRTEAAMGVGEKDATAMANVGKYVSKMTKRR